MYSIFRDSVYEYWAYVFCTGSKLRHGIFFFEKWKVLRQGIYLNYVRLYFVMVISCDIAGIAVLMCK